ncbi:MAG: NAD-dependent protein deacylase [Coprobacillus sp.]|nr:NAD-dependent protein deacylase [Coprobacillus sp.]
MDEIDKLYQTINEAKSIVVFTGAGISTGSGIPDFRGANGIFIDKGHQYTLPPEEIVSHHFFYENTKDFYKFYKEKMCFREAKPNSAHLYFASLEKKGKNVTVVTQNIDGLHQAAGSSRVYELHGSIHRNYCEKCNKFFDLDYVLDHEGVPYCDKCGGLIKPDVVLYEEGLDNDMCERAISAIMTCDTMIIVGTSLRVYPAAGFVRYFKGKNLILINKDKTSYDGTCDILINDDIINVVNKLNEKEHSTL